MFILSARSRSCLPHCLIYIIWKNQIVFAVYAAFFCSRENIVRARREDWVQRSRSYQIPLSPSRSFGVERCLIYMICKIYITFAVLPDLHYLKYLDNVRRILLPLFFRFSGEHLSGQEERIGCKGTVWLHFWTQILHFFLTEPLSHWNSSSIATDQPLQLQPLQLVNHCNWSNIATEACRGSGCIF